MTGIANNATISRLPSLTEDRWTFGGWYKEPACIYKWNESAGTVTTNTTLYARWTKVEETKKTSDYIGGYNASSGYAVTSNLGAITKVMADGTTVDSKNYTVSGGNVYLTQSYLNTLTNGKHTVELYNNDKAATATITVSNSTVVKSSKTGDTGILLYAGLAISSILGMGYIKKKEF